MADNTHQNGAEPQPTPAAEFRSVREEGVLQELPSGRIVRMRNVTPESLLRLGQIPDPLATLALRSLYGQLQQGELRDFVAPREETQDALDMVESLRIVCTAALVYPRIVEEPQADDEIHIEDLSSADRGWIFTLAFQEVNVLRSFRFEPQPDVDDVPEQSGDEQPAEQHAEPE